MLIIFDHTSTAIRGTLPDTPPASTRRLLVLLKASGREGQGAGAGVNGPFWAQMAPPRRRINVPLEAKNPATQVKRSAHPDSSRNLPHHNPPNQRSNPPTSCHSAPSTIHLSTAPRRGIKKYTRKSSDTSTPWRNGLLPGHSMSDILNEHLGHLEHLHHQNSRRHPTTHRTRANGPKWTHLDPPFETHLRSKWRKMLHFESTPFADRGTTQEQSTCHIACPRGKPARSFPLRPPQTRHKSTARRSKAHRHQSPRSAARPLVRRTKSMSFEGEPRLATRPA